MRTKTHWAFAAIAASALALAGCGGGGSSSTTTVAPPAGPPASPPATEPPPAPTPEAVTLPSADNKYLEPADTTLEDTTAPVMLATGGTHDVGAYTLTCTVGPCEIEIADGAVTATGTVEAAYTTAAMATIDAAKTVAADENSGRSLGMHSALTDATGTRGEQIIGEATSKDNLVITRGMSGGAMVTNGQLGGTSGWTSGMADNAVSGFEGHKRTRKTEKIVVYTDIKAAKHKAFLTHYVGATPATIGTVTVTAVTDVTSDDYGQIALPAATIVAAGNAGLLDATKFPQPKDEGKGDNTYTYNDGEGASEKSSTFKGTFHGAPGTYDCPTTPCVVQVSDRSTANEPAYDATLTTGDWTFTPDVDNNPQIVNQDGDHMHFGWWVKTPAAAAAEGQYLYDAEMFYGGSRLFNTEATINALDGDADYSGPAAGLFAVKGDNAAHGEFTATARLTAKFGNATDPGSINGKIASFVRDDGVANDWSVTLASTAINTTGGNTAAAAGTTNSRVTGGSNDNIGAWEFQMYGPGTAGADPTGIAGAFRAAIDKDTAVAGAFATTPQ